LGADLSRKRTIVLASGVFDLLHYGHIKFLEEAKKAGGENAELVVIVARDSTVEKTKGKPPIMGECQRAALVESLKVVDKAVLGYLSFNIGDVIEKLKPNVIALGYDQDDVMNEVRNYIRTKNLGVKVVKIGKFGEIARYSSSKIKQKIIEKLSNEANDEDGLP